MVRQKHLLHVFPTFVVGGSQVRFAQLVRLHGSRYRHTVIALDNNFAMASRLDGLDVSILRIDNRKEWVLKKLWAIRKILDQIQPDTLVTYNWGSMEWALINRLGSRRPHIHIEDGFGPEETTAQLQRRVWARRLILSESNTDVILPSKILEGIAANVWKLPRPRLHYIPNGIDCARFVSPARSRERKNPEVVIGTVAALRPEKNISRLMRAFVGISDHREPGRVRLIIVGDGPDRVALERFASTLSARNQIFFAGSSHQPEVWLQKMDVFALSSDTEQMPLSVLEAMASGLPVVATKVGDIAQMVSSENTEFIVPANREFGLALDRLVGDQNMRHNIGCANAQRARDRFDEHLMAERYAQIIG